MENSAKKLDTLVDLQPGDYAWDKMTREKFVVLEEDRDNPSHWCVYGNTSTPRQSRHKHSLTSIKPKRRWYLLWLA